MQSYRLLLVLFFLCFACLANGEQSVGKQRINPETATDQLYTKYLDHQSGISIVVFGTVPQTTALAWLSEVVRANDAQAADTLVKSNSSQGLLRTALGEAGKKPPDLKPRVITRYTDTKTDRYILVAEGTSQEDALARLQEAAKVESDTAMVNLLRAHHKEGLISTRLKLQNIGKNGTDVILSWGDIHRKYKPSSSLTNYRDSSTGRSISVRGGTREDVAAWLKELVNAQGASSLHRLVSDNHVRGLVFAMMQVSDHVRLTAYLDE